MLNNKQIQKSNSLPLTKNLESNQQFGGITAYAMKSNDIIEVDQIHIQQQQKPEGQKNRIQRKAQLERINSETAENKTFCQRNCSTFGDILCFPFKLLLTLLIFALMLPCILIIFLIIFCSFLCVVWGTACQFIKQKWRNNQICIAILCIITFPISCFIIFCLQAGQTCKSINTDFGIANSQPMKTIW